jgi:methionyl-tRNA synthetase
VRAIFNSPDLQLGWKSLPETFAINPGTQLFPRVDGKVFFAETEAPQGDAAQRVGSAVPQGDAAQRVGSAVPQRDAAPAEGLIEIQDFKKVQMVVARVLEARKVEKADKLLQLKIDTGSDTRTLVAGIALFYKPEDLVGRKIIIVKNLKPAKLRGILSQGMILAASDAGNRPYIPILPEDTPVGAILK